MNKDQFAYLNEEIQALTSERDLLADQVGEWTLTLERQRVEIARWRTVAERMAEALRGFMIDSRKADGKEPEIQADIFCRIEERIEKSLALFEAMEKDK